MRLTAVVRASHGCGTLVSQLWYARTTIVGRAFRQGQRYTFVGSEANITWAFTKKICKKSGKLFGDMKNCSTFANEISL